MKIKIKSRIDQLKAMHKVMVNSNDENLYMFWITGGVPDCPTDDDFEFMAEDDECYNEACDLFADLIKDKGFRF